MDETNLIKTASIQYSAFTSILKVLAEAPSRDSLKDIDALLRSVLVENSILQATSSFPAVLTSFETVDTESLQHQVAFFDNCACRVAKKPVHYYDLLGNLHQDASKPVSPLVSAITEQWPFVVKAGNATKESAVSAWIARVLGKLRQMGEDSKVLKAARDNLVNATEDKKVKYTFKKSLKGSEEDADDAKSAPVPAKPASDSNQAPRVDLEEIFGALPTEGKTHNELQKWDREDLEVSVEQGRVGDLMLCLCSEYEEVRRQALANVSRFMTKLRVCSFTPPVWRSNLTGEIRNRSTASGDRHSSSAVSWWKP